MRADYKLPLPVLRGYLGPSTLTEFESANAPGAFHRAWHCGCIAQYRNSAHQTAVWRPCAVHRSNPGQSTEVAVTRVPEAASDGSERRSDPNFCIIDADLNVLCKSPGSHVEHLMRRVCQVIEGVVADGAATVVPVDTDTVLRIMPLLGNPTAAFVVVVEAAAAKED